MGFVLTGYRDCRLVSPLFVGRSRRGRGGGEGRRNLQRKLSSLPVAIEEGRDNRRTMFSHLDMALRRLSRPYGIPDSSVRVDTVRRRQADSLPYSLESENEKP